jgi:hypothetical protein
MSPYVSNSQWRWAVSCKVGKWHTYAGKKQSDTWKAEAIDYLALLGDAPKNGINSLKEIPEKQSLIIKHSGRHRL